MRCGIIAMLLFLFLATPTIEASAKEPVPLGNWCYDSLEYLLAKGCLPTIYQAWFDEEKQLYFQDVRGLTTIAKQVTLMGRPKSVSTEKWEFIRLLTQMLADEFGHSLNYGSPYEDVPIGHWSYGALDYLTRNATLVGYPEGYFTGRRVLTCYEFAQATARIVDSIDEGTEDEHVLIIVKALKERYSAQLDPDTFRPVISIDYQYKF